jgi:4-hydroxy-3-methylbut-2-enyl diphosphate reductase IspH
MLTVNPTREGARTKKVLLPKPRGFCAGVIRAIDIVAIALKRVADVDTLQNVRQDRVVYTTQTTLSLDDTQAIVDRLKQRFPSIVSPSTSGASTPEILVEQVLENLKAWGFENVEEFEVIEEDVLFPLPASLEGLTRTGTLR